MSIVRNLSTGTLAYRNEVRDFQLWHETAMPALSPQIRYEGTTLFILFQLGLVAQDRVHQ
jgi:hypothetical protein